MKYPSLLLLSLLLHTLTLLLHTLTLLYLHTSSSSSSILLSIIICFIIYYLYLYLLLYCILLSSSSSSSSSFFFSLLFLFFFSLLFLTFFNHLPTYLHERHRRPSHFFETDSQQNRKGNVGMPCGNRERDLLVCYRGTLSRKDNWTYK